MSKIKPIWAGVYLTVLVALTLEIPDSSPLPTSFKTYPTDKVSRDSPPALEYLIRALCAPAPEIEPIIWEI